MTSSSKTCDYQWPNARAWGDDEGTVRVHVCAEPVGHTDWHICRDGARRDADLLPPTAATQRPTPVPASPSTPGTATGLSGAAREHVKGTP